MNDQSNLVSGEADSNNQDDDHNGAVEFDLLDSLEVMTINNQVTPYSDFRHPLGSVHSVSSSQPPDTSIGSLHFNLIVDSGCTRHMFPYKELFISYKDTPSSCVILADKSKVPSFGTGTVRLFLQNKPIIIHDVLHVPRLCSPLLSIRCFRQLAGCSFIAHNTGSFLIFPTFVLPVDDSSDCTISGRFCSSTNVEFDSRITGSTAAVSFQNNRRPLITKPSDNFNQARKEEKKSDDDILPHTTIPSTSKEPLDTTLQQCTSNLSSTQLQEIATAITNHLQKRGRVTMELINFIKDGYSSSTNSTSSTPSGHPSLLSSDKMSNVAPKHSRYTVQQLSHYFGFCSFKNWDVFHDVCQPNFSFINTTDLPLELGS